MSDEVTDKLILKKGAKACPGCGKTPPYRHTIECGGFDAVETGAWKCSCGWQAPECSGTWADGLDKWNKRSEPVRPNQHELVGVTFNHPDLGVSFVVESVNNGVATMRRYEIVLVERLVKEWHRDAEMDELRKMQEETKKEQGQ